jgi:hypothetical protein
MGRFLIKYYPIQPAQNFEVINLDVLNVKDYCSKNYQEKVKNHYEEYLSALHNKHCVKKGELIAYNNSWYGIFEAVTVEGAISKFFDELRDR